MTYPENPSDTGYGFASTLRHDTYPFIDPKAQTSLVGKTVFVTGASRGCGRATAISYAQAGASGIILGARSSQTSVVQEVLAAAEKAGRATPRVLALNLDVLRYDSVQAAAQQIKEQFGKLDILVNNAGYLSKFAKIADSDPEDWWRNYEINIRGVYFVTKALLPLILEGGMKTIVNVGSRGGHVILAGSSGYCCTKYDLMRFTEFLIADHGDEGLLAFVVHPGAVSTDLSLKMPENMLSVLTDTPQLAGDTIAFLTSTRREWLAGRYVNCLWDMETFLSFGDEIVKNDKLKMRCKF